MGVSALLATIFLPLAGSLAVMLIERSQVKAIKVTTLVMTIITFLASLLLLPEFDQTSTAMQFTVDAKWIPALDAGFRIGIDGTSLLMILLTTFIMPIAMLASWDSITKQTKE